MKFSEKDKQDYLEEIAKFEAALEHLKECQKLWREHWSYGTDGSPMLVSMQQASHRLYQEASNTRAWLQEVKDIWKIQIERGGTCADQEVAPPR